MLVSLKSFRDYTGVFSDEGNSSPSLYLQTATQIVESYLGYPLNMMLYDKTYRGTGTNEIQLNSKPINIIYKVAIDGRLQDTENFYSDNEYLIFDGGIFPAGSTINVVYKTGYREEHDDPADEPIPEPRLTKEDIETEVCGSVLPYLIKMTILRIAALLQSEADNNIGTTSRSFGESGSRTFVSYTNYEKWLQPISGYRLLRI